MRPSRLLVLAAALVTGISCGGSETVTSAGGSAPAMAHLAIAPSFSPGATQAWLNLAQLGLDVTNVHVVLTAPDGTIRDTVVAFPVGQETLGIELLVPGSAVGKTFIADVELRSADNIVLFKGRQSIVAQGAGIGSGGNTTPTPITVTYTGPGATIRAVTVTPPASTVVGVQNFPVVATATDQNNANVSNVLVQWTSSDATIATVTSTGNATATVATTGKRGSASITATSPTGVIGTATVAVTPAPARLVVISGGGQTAFAGSTLPQPLVVEAQGSDNQPVSGVTVAFRGVTVGGTVGTASVAVDANGRASTTMKLGNTPGAYVFEAASGTLSVVTVSQVATQPPPASLEIVSGDGQSALGGTALPAPLRVRVLDQFAAPVANVAVQWTRVTGSGAFASGTTTTGADGIASNTYTLGVRAGTETATASLPGVTGDKSIVTFSLVSRAGSPAFLSPDGSGQHALVNARLPLPLSVRVLDQNGSPVQGANVLWSVTGLSTTATFSSAGGVTDASGAMSTIVTLGPTAGPLEITAAVGTLRAIFTATIDPSTPVGASGTLAGYVYAASTQSGLAGVAVTVRQGQVVVATTTTLNDGTFTTAQLPGGTYDVVFAASGYVTSTIVGQLVNGNTTTLAVPMVVASATPGGISGTVQSARTAQGISETTVTVELRAGLNNSTGTVIQTVTANSNGQYSFQNVAAGSYTVRAGASGYTSGSVTGISVGASTTTANQNIVLSPTGSVGSVRVVVTWLASPRDLDSYLSGPFTNPSIIYYGSKGNCGGPPYACLDVDVTSGYGPETMTIVQQSPGTYRYSVRNYSQEIPLSQSGAHVDLYINNVLTQSFSVPSGTGIVWTVFELNGTSITPINVLGNSVVSGGTNGLLSHGGGQAAVRDDLRVIEAVTAAHPKGKAPIRQ